MLPQSDDSYLENEDLPFYYWAIKEDTKNTPDMVELNQQNFHYVFVYGTLKYGYGNHKLINPYNNAYLGCGFTVDEHYTMKQWSNEGIPMVYEGDMIDSPQEQRGKIFGEVFVVRPEGMRKLDRLEGNGSLYVRKRVPVRLSTGKHASSVVTCWIYVAATPRNAQNQELSKLLYAKLREKEDNDYTKYGYFNWTQSRVVAQLREERRALKKHV